MYTITHTLIADCPRSGCVSVQLQLLLLLLLLV
jgi:hypothetical protein